MRKTYLGVLVAVVPFALAARRNDVTKSGSRDGVERPSAIAAASIARPRDALSVTIQGPAIVGAECPCYNYEADASGGTPPYTYQWQDASTGQFLSNYEFGDTGAINFSQVVVDVWDSNGGHAQGSDVIKVCPFPAFSC
jgi:hypothetical protein